MPGSLSISGAAEAVVHHVDGIKFGAGNAAITVFVAAAGEADGIQALYAVDGVVVAVLDSRAGLSGEVAHLFGGEGVADAVVGVDGPGHDLRWYWDVGGGIKGGAEAALELDLLQYVTLGIVFDKRVVVARVLDSAGLIEGIEVAEGQGIVGGVIHLRDVAEAVVGIAGGVS